MALVDNSQIQGAELLKPLPLYLHTYVAPFAIIWPIFARYFYTPELYAKHIGSSEWTFVWCGAIITLQSLVWLSTNWSVNLKALFTARKASRIEDAQLIKVIPIANAGSADICKLVRDKVGDKTNLSFLFQKRRFLYDPAKKSFSTLTYEIDAEPKPKIGKFQKSTGISSQAELTRLEQYYGSNTFDIPVPTFTELFREHAVAPFFVFQVFCVGLWMLDEYWYYSLFTLFMLVAFESTVVWQRQRTLVEFRGMSIKPYDMWVYRLGKWTELESDKLLPGDLVSVGRTKEDSGVACDMLLVEGTAIEKPKLASGVPPPPDNGAMAIVMKTGFETSQGSLVRTMIYSTERVFANNAEALFFILFLLIFAVAASCVVPPELPMELSLAVNTSLAALAKFAIFCTEPFRIPFAGRIDIACFDKTGTLTGEDLVVEGIAGLGLGHTGTNTPRESDGAHSHLTFVKDAGMETTLVLASAHALVKLEDGEIVGDPMEKATLAALGWGLGKNDTLAAKPAVTAAGGTSGAVQIKRRFQFSSALKRQSSVATVNAADPKTGNKVRGTFVGVKGAPETIMRMLVSIPKDYEETFKYFTRRGSRVLALAYKQLTYDSELGSGKINDLKLSSKDDAKQAVQMLNESSHRVVMITGDNPLTAVHVAREVEIVDRDVLILDAPEQNHGGEKLVWRSVDDKTNVEVDASKPIDPEIIKSKDICVTGYALAKFKDNKAAWRSLLRHTWVYARVSPKQKEEILLGLKDMGYFTLMAGDGTNVGALKQAHIGIALLNGTQEDLTRIAEHSRNTKMKELYQKQIDLMKRFNQPAPPVPPIIAHLYPPGPSNPHYEKAMEREAQKRGVTVEELAKLNGTNIETVTSPGARQLLNQDPRASRQQEVANKAAGFADKMTTAMMEQELGDDEPPTLKLGDASVAAPFTSKLRNVIAVPNIIRQGRCTLVATIQMYKILALNCLISAYSLSVLYLEGIKFGDGQITISGMLMSVCFLSISRAKSVEGLSKERPQPNIFNFYIIGSILGQFAVHIATLIYIARFCDKLEPRSEMVDLEAEFKPSLLNSAVYLLQLIQQISTFAVNYQGRPFRESLSENRGMYWGIISVTGIAFACSTEFFPELNEQMKLVKFTEEFKTTMTAVMVIDYAACYIIEVILKRLFSDFRPRDIAMRRPEQNERERVRKEAEKALKDAEEEKKQAEKVAAFERKLEERKQKIREATQAARAAR
ncbi:Manganese-transporting ATPase 1 [Daldinia childiae]|uniref:Manganese-transporting ATPase 1 n=1 Tax=Daldinia childiae TaxID=326645 RepID=UPI0014458734|nr:Manganese-transporting ATPase 1 [Daldinia childiae]KAF3065925.1 Manganese-transporting ATPase 1 [Daldinia childiae]